jgi:hypothetical protein
VTINAFNPPDIEPDRVFRFMALIAIGCPVGSQQREPAQVMDMVDVAYKP